MQGMMIQNKKVCDKCKNEKYITETQKIEVEIPPGSPNGHKIRFYGEGEPISEGEPPSRHGNVGIASTPTILYCILAV